jgi:hypothetical protein
MSVKMLKNLLLKSSRLQIEIEQEQKKLLPDRFRLIKLKKTRLFIKDRLRALISRSAQGSGLMSMQKSHAKS